MKQNLRDAIAAGDADAQADIMLSISRADSDLRQLQQGKQQYEAQAAAAQTTEDPVEKIASRLTPRSADWVRAHPEYARDPAMTRRMVRAHEDAMDEGIKADTDEYFEFVETKLKIRKQQHQHNVARHRLRHPYRAHLQQVRVQTSLRSLELNVKQLRRSA